MGSLRPDEREDFLSRRNWDSFFECARRTGAIMWGRKTHEKVRAYGRQYFDAMKELTTIVVSTDPNVSLEGGFERATSPQDAVSRIEAKGFPEATLAGGSILNASFAKARLIDAVEINIEAVVIGRGIPLFAVDDFDLKLDLVTVRQIDDRIVQVRYAVRRE
jgi:dihydrofolate reductase